MKKFFLICLTSLFLLACERADPWGLILHQSLDFTEMVKKSLG